MQFGGQTPLKLARALEQAGAPIIGTTPTSIHQAEDREFFQQLLSDLDLLQPPNRIANSPDEALQLAEEIGYPLVVRPSYVLGGRGMEIVYNAKDLTTFMGATFSKSFDSPVLLDRFLNDAVEVDVDAVCDGDTVIIGGIMEHIEEAGVHSGDSACSLPPFSLSRAIEDELRKQTRAMALALNVVGLMNVQFAVKGDQIYVLEVNPTSIPDRAVCIQSNSQTPGQNRGTMHGWSVIERIRALPVSRFQRFIPLRKLYFRFIKFPGVDTVLGPEMKSTGEVMGIGDTAFGEAFEKSQNAAH